MLFQGGGGGGECKVVVTFLSLSPLLDSTARGLEFKGHDEAGVYAKDGGRCFV